MSMKGIKQQTEAETLRVVLMETTQQCSVTVSPLEAEPVQTGLNYLNRHQMCCCETVQSLQSVILVTVMNY